MRDDLRIALQTLQIVSTVRGLAGAKSGGPLRLSEFTLGRLIEGPPAMTPEQASALHDRFVAEQQSRHPKP